MERETGQTRYLTDAPCVGGTLRTVPEDFRVEEVPTPVAPVRDEGKYTLATVEATNWETHALAKALARAVDVRPERVHFSGTKDRRAVTVQRFAIPAPEEDVEAVDVPRVTILETARSDRAPKLGELHGNRFVLRLRSLDVPLDVARDRAQAVLDVLDEVGVPNYYGVQRFGTVRPVSHVVGRRILAGDLQGAVQSYLADTHPREPDRTRKPRERFRAEPDPQAALAYFPHSLGHERAMLRHLADEPGDWAGALETLPRNLLQMLVYAHQSLLFNLILSRRLEDPDLDLVEPAPGDIVLPADEHGVADDEEPTAVTERNRRIVARTCARDRGLVSGVVFGHSVPLADGAMGTIEREVVDEDGLEAGDYRVEAFPGIDAAGTRRALRAPVRDPGLEAGEDERGPFLELRFFLPKGAYATCLLREVMKADDVRSY